MLTTVSILFVGFLFGFSFSRLLYQEFTYIRKWKLVGRQKGYQFHHSMYGVVLLFALPLIHLQMTYELLLFSLAVGIITDHTLNEGFIFITRPSQDKITKLLLSEYFMLIFWPQIEKSQLAFEETMSNSKHSLQ